MGKGHNGQRELVIGALVHRFRKAKSPTDLKYEAFVGGLKPLIHVGGKLLGSIEFAPLIQQNEAILIFEALENLFALFDFELFRIEFAAIFDVGNQHGFIGQIVLQAAFVNAAALFEVFVGGFADVREGGFHSGA